MQKADPVTRLTPAEAAFVDHLNATGNRDQILAELKTNLQTAIEIELATIPIYLYTYYSIVRNAASGENIDRVQAYANKAGGVIMSVAVEEMLHMSLSSNVLFSMGVAPQLYRRAPGQISDTAPPSQAEGPARAGRQNRRSSFRSRSSASSSSGTSSRSNIRKVGHAAQGPQLDRRSANSIRTYAACCAPNS